MSCGCNKKIKKENDNNNDVEHFSYDGAKNMCHYTCSSINTTNIILLILIVILIYLFIKKS
jgi:hypothetical protein